MATTPTTGPRRDPRTKAELIDKMMARDFSGDLADLAVNRDLTLRRVRPNAVSLYFGESGTNFELTVRKPRGPKTKRASRPARTPANEEEAEEERPAAATRTPARRRRPARQEA